MHNQNIVMLSVAQYALFFEKTLLSGVRITPTDLDILNVVVHKSLTPKVTGAGALGSTTAMYSGRLSHASATADTAEENEC